MGWALVEEDWAGGVIYQHVGSNGIYYAEAWVVTNLSLAAMVVANAAGRTTFDAAEETIEKIAEMIMVPVISECPGELGLDCHPVPNHFRPYFQGETSHKRVLSL